LNADLTALKSFILRRHAGRGLYASGAHICRRAERIMVELRDQPGETVTDASLKYVNRLSDFLFVAAATPTTRARVTCCGRRARIDDAAIAGVRCPGDERVCSIAADYRAASRLRQRHDRRRCRQVLTSQTVIAAGFCFGCAAGVRVMKTQVKHARLFSFGLDQIVGGVSANAGDRTNTLIAGQRTPAIAASSIWPGAPQHVTRALVVGVSGRRQTGNRTAG